MKTVTVSDVISWHPCWLDELGGEDRVRATLAPLGETFDARAILGLAEVSADDRLWAALQPELLPDRTLRVFACRCARRALERERASGREPDPRSWAAVDVAEQHARGEATSQELDAASDAASDAAYDASAAWGAASAAASRSR